MMEERLMQLCKDKTVLFAGCGGGYDCYGSLLMYHQIQKVAKHVIFTNLTFTRDWVLAKAGKQATVLASTASWNVHSAPGSNPKPCVASAASRGVDARPLPRCALA